MSLHNAYPSQGLSALAAARSSNIGNFQDLDDEALVEICRLATIWQSKMLSSDSSGRKVLILSENTLVKFGLGVTQQEASAQQLAFVKADREAVRVPQIYRFFTRRDDKSLLVGYLVMELIDGVTLERTEWNSTDTLIHLTAAIDAIHAIRGYHPGPISGGQACGSLWSEYGTTEEFHDVRDLETYLNKRLSYVDGNIHMNHVNQEDLCLCHMDLAPRNIMIDSRGKICILDWACAGFYPRYFELWSLDFARQTLSNNFGDDLLGNLRPSFTECAEAQKLTLVYRLNSRCNINRSSEETDIIMAAIEASEFDNT